MRLASMWIVGLAASVAPAAAAELVGPKQLQQEWLDGRSVSTVGPRGGKSEFVFKPDGKVLRAGGRAGASEGTWRLDEDGFCMKLGQARRESCYLAVRQADGALRVMRRSGGAFVWSR